MAALEVATLLRLTCKNVTLHGTLPLEMGL